MKFCVHYHFWFTKNQLKKIPYKYIGGKKKKYPNKIISTDIILSFNVYTMPFFFIL